MKTNNLFFRINIAFAVFLLGSIANVNLYSQTASLPFEEKFSTSNSLWTIVDNNKDNKTWAVETSSQRAKCTWTSGVAMDDYLISPLFELKEGKTYELTFDLAVTNSRYAEKMKVLLGTGVTAEAQNKNNPLADYPGFSNTSYQTKKVEIKVPSTGQYTFSFYVYSPSFLDGVLLKNVSLKEIVNIPGKAENFLIKTDEENKLKALLSWNNPTLNSKGGTLKPEELTKLEIYRNSELVHTISGLTTGADMTWEEVLSTNGNYTYKIIPYNENNAGTEATASKWFGAGLGLPYENSLTTQKLFDEMIVVDANNDGKTWKYNSTEGCARREYSSANPGNDYLITPPLELKKGKTYKLSFEYSGSGTTSYYIEDLKVKIGRGATAESQSVELKNYPQIASRVFIKDNFLFSVESDGDYNLSFFCYSASGKDYLKVKNIAITEEVTLPGAVTNVLITPAADKSLKAGISWKNPELTSTGNSLNQSDLTKIAIYRNDKTEALTILNNPVVGATVNWTDEAVPQSGKYTYTITPYNGDHAGQPLSLSSSWIGGGLLPPYTNNFTQAAFNDLTIIDANNDTKTWKWKSGNSAEYNSTAIPNDFLLSIPLELTARKVYKIDFTYKTDGGYISYDEQHLKLVATKTPTNEQIIEIADYPAIEYSSYENARSAYFMPEESGTYYIGLWLCSEKGSTILIKQLQINEETVIFPDVVTNVGIEPSKENPLHTILKWNNPSLSSIGGTLEAGNLTKVEIYRDDSEQPVYKTDDPVIGTEETWTDESELSAGIHHYHFMAYNGQFAGKKLTVAVWIGDGVSTPYQNELNSQEKFNEMVVRDDNRDEKTWSWHKDGFAQYNSSKENAANDYLMTPAIEMKKGFLYKLIFNYSGSGTTGNHEQKLEVLLTKGYTASSEITRLLNYPSFASDKFYKSENTFSVNESGKYIISFKCYSDADKYALKINGISVEEIPVRPEKISGLSVTPDDNKETKATIGWTNPQLNQIKEPLLEGQLTKIEIYRNNQLIQSVTGNLIAGEKLSWKDENVSGKGKYTYKLIPYNDIYAGVPDSVTVWVGEGMELPYENSIATNEKFDEFIILNKSGDNTWTWNKSGFAQLESHRDFAADDYLVTPSLKLKAGIKYKLLFDYSRSGGAINDEEKMKIFIGKSPDAINMTNLIKDYDNITHKEFKSDSVYVIVDEDNDYFMSFYCYSDRRKSTLCLKNIKVEETITLPGKVTAETISAGENKALTATLSWINPSVDAFGEALHPVNLTSIKIFRSDKPEAIKIIPNPETGKPLTWKDESVPAEGLYFYRIIPYNGDKPGETSTVKSWIGKGAGIPYQNSIASLADFEYFTILDHNQDNITWKLHPDGYAVYDVRFQETGDDYLFSPPLRLEKGITYKLSFYYASYNGFRKDKMKVMLGKAKSAENQTTLKDYPEISSALFNKDELILSVNETDDYFLSFYAYSDGDGWNVRVKDMKITETYTTPGVATHASVIPAENKVLKATVNWTNPSVNTTNTALLPEQLTKVEIFRDQEAKAVYTKNNPAPGAQETWTDGSVPATGNHTYRIVSYNGEYAGEAISVRAWIGGGLELPYLNTFSETGFADVTVTDANNDGKTWKWKNDEAQYESYTQPDDWMISPALNLKKGKLYQISFNYRTSGGALYFNKQLIKVTAGTEAAIEKQTIPVGDFNEIEFSALYNPKTTTFSVDKDSTYYLGLHLCSEKGEYIYINQLSVKEIYLNVTSPKEYKKNEADFKTETVNIQSNVSWKATTTAGWINLDNAVATGNGSFTFSCNANSGDMRMGEIVIANDFLTQTIVINQSGTGIRSLNTKITGTEERDVDLSWTTPNYGNIKFNVYRDGSLIASAIEAKTYKDASLAVREEPYCYTVSILYANGTETTPSQSSCVTVTGKSGITDLTNSEILFVTNPVSTLFRVESQVKVNKLDVFDFNGKQILSIPVNATSLVLNVTGWTNGIYMVRIDTEAGTGIYKVIKK